jgi:hypothetical protein
LVTRIENQREKFIFCLNYINFKFLYLILSVLIFFSNYL